MQNNHNTRPIQIDFGNGWTYHVHGVRNGEVYFQRWAPGVEKQSFIDNLGRMPIDKFWNAVADAIKLIAPYAR